ncbi:helix-turn-helix domain-containing protein [Phormidesmis priestleyi]
MSPLKTIRQLLKLTQKQFAERIGSDQNVVSRWERGVSEATFTIAQIKAMDELLEGMGLTWKDIPDSLAPYANENAET